MGLTTVTAAEAVARVQVTDTIGFGLGPGQPPAFLKALGGRDDWQDLRLYGALLTVWSEAYKHPNVHYLSGFWGPVERALRDSGENLSFRADRLPPLHAADGAHPPARDGDSRRPS